MTRFESVNEKQACELVEGSLDIAESMQLEVREEEIHGMYKNIYI